MHNYFVIVYMNHKKIRIIWASGSGKSTIATQLWNMFWYSVSELDDILYKKKYDIKRTKEDRKEILGRIISSETWIIEWVSASEWTIDTFSNSDIILYCYTWKLSLIYRLIKRERWKWISRKYIFGLIRYSLDYKKRTPELEIILGRYKEKVILVDTDSDINELIQKIKT